MFCLMSQSGNTVYNIDKIESIGIGKQTCSNGNLNIIVIQSSTECAIAEYKKEHVRAVLDSLLFAFISSDSNLLKMPKDEEVSAIIAKGKEIPVLLFEDDRASDELYGVMARILTNDMNSICVNGLSLSPMFEMKNKK